MKTALRFFAFFLLLFLFLHKNTSIIGNIHAQTSNSTNSANISSSSNLNPYVMPDTNPDVPQNLHTLTQSVMISVLATAVCQLSGYDPMSQQGKCLGVDAKTGKIGFVEQGGGLIGMTGSLIAMTYTKPASSMDYIVYLSSNFGIVKKAQAQGVGFEGIRPLLNIWRAFRNISFLLFILVTIVIGLGIMLRLQADPRTVMTIQNQIPKIIIGLILVSFSFAVAGFLIDLMWVVIYLVFSIFATIDPQIAQEISSPAVDTGKSLFTAMRDTPFQFANHMTMSGIHFDRYSGPNGLLALPWNAAKDVGEFLKNLIALSVNSPGIENMTTLLVAAIPPQNLLWIGCVLVKTLNPIDALGRLGSVQGDVAYQCAHDLVTGANTAAGNVIGGFATLIAFLIFLIALLWAMFRLWIALLLAYVYVLLDIIFAPFWILGGVLPGGGGGFGSWLKDIISHLVAFPATIVMFLLAKVLMSEFISGTTTDYPFVPPLIGNPGDSNIIASFIGFAIILMTPAVPKMMRDALKVRPFPYVAAIGAAVGVGQGVTGGTSGAVWHRLTRPRGQFNDPGRLRQWLYAPQSPRPTWIRRGIRNVIGHRESQ